MAHTSAEVSQEVWRAARQGLWIRVRSNLHQVVSEHHVGHSGGGDGAGNAVTLVSAVGLVAAAVVAAAAAVTQYAHSSHSGWPAPQMPTLHHAAQLMRFWQNEHGEHSLP